LINLLFVFLSPDCRPSGLTAISMYVFSPSLENGKPLFHFWRNSPILTFTAKDSSKWLWAFHTPCYLKP
jgi:hypothetical protein